jgi:predicted AAA+ superfamily ATPase
LYLVDPLVAHLPRRLRQSEASLGMTAVVENAVITALLRGEERPLVEEFTLPQALVYWKSKSGGEVDALVGSRSGTPVEVKYRGAVTRRVIAALTRWFRRGVVVTRQRRWRSGCWRERAWRHKWVRGGPSGDQNPIPGLVY